MAQATPPDLTTTAHSLLPLSRTYPQGLSIEPHAHAWGQLLYAEHGLAWVDAPDTALLVPAHRAVWIPPHVPHGIRVVHDLDMHNLYLRREVAERMGAQLTVVEVSPLLRELIKRRVNLAPHPENDYQDALDTFLMVELRRARFTPMRVPMPAGGDRRLRSLCEQVLRAPSLQVSFEAQAEAVGASTRTLARLFKAELGVSFMDWRRQVQLAYACARLMEAVAVNTVAVELGYNLSSFSEMFKRFVGVAPSAYAAAQTTEPDQGV